MYFFRLVPVTPNDILQVCCTCLIITATCVYVPHASRGFDVPLSSALVIFMAKHISQYVYIVFWVTYIVHPGPKLAWEQSEFLFLWVTRCNCQFCYAISLGKV